MNNTQKFGGVAALYQAGAYLWGIVYFLFIVNYPSIVDPAQKMAFLMDNQVSMQITHLLMYVVFGVFLVVLSLALHERLNDGSSSLIRIATSFGLIWASAVIASGMIYNNGLDTVATLYARAPVQAASAWLSIESVSEGLGGGNGELLGGMWTLLVSWAALRTRALPKALNYLGVAVGAIGIISTIPGLKELGGLFGMSQIVWFIWLGIILLHGSLDAAEQK